MINLASKKLVELHSEDPQLCHCAACDGESKYVTTFYKELEPEGHLGFQTYLACCQKEVGEIIDWYSWEEHNKVIGKITIGGITMNKTKGYKR